MAAAAADSDAVEQCEWVGGDAAAANSCCVAGDNDDEDDGDLEGVADDDGKESPRRPGPCCCVSCSSWWQTIGATKWKYRCRLWTMSTTLRLLKRPVATIGPASEAVAVVCSG